MNSDLLRGAKVLRCLWLKQAGVVKAGDRVIVSKADRRHHAGGTNTLKVLEVV